ncbi:MAG: hypothetical protein FWH55_09770 [Oscillospiraceae bacterium]|nr:hypothetical protein [Oscillospiraceae bacterium]
MIIREGQQKYCPTPDPVYYNQEDLTPYLKAGKNGKAKKRDGTAIVFDYLNLTTSTGEAKLIGVYDSQS